MSLLRQLLAVTVVDGSLHRCTPITLVALMQSKPESITMRNCGAVLQADCPPYLYEIIYITVHANRNRMAPIILLSYRTGNQDEFWQVNQGKPGKEQGYTIFENHYTIFICEPGELTGG